jgi:hypothetical protein
MPVKLSHLGLFMSGGTRKRGFDEQLSNKFGGDEWKKWRKEVGKLHYVFFRCGTPYPAEPGEEALYESFNASLLWLIATDKTYRSRGGFTLQSISEIGDEACVHAEAFRRPTLALPPPVPRLPSSRPTMRGFRPRLRPPGGATVQSWVAKTPEHKVLFMQDLLSCLQDNGWCLDSGVEFAFPVRATLFQEGRYKCRGLKGRDQEGKRER